jgi:phosphomannomutase
MSIDPALRERIEAWAAIDAEHGADLRRLLGDDPDEAARLFDGRIAFGTAGLRAAMGPGPERMNRLVVRQTTAGLMDWLPPGPTVVVGYDARRHSQRFAHDVAAVVAARGGRVELIDRPAPTPVLALAVLDRDADAGIMITASHNPAGDNGYKLYLGDGIQLVPPADAEIAAAIDAVADSDPLPDADRAPGPSPEAVDIAEVALARHREVALAALTTDQRDVAVLYTAMHGVGGRHVIDCFEAAGFPAPSVVAEQFEPDPAFPTAAFPNPEEAGALDLALAQAEREGVDLILANDPDADRLAVGVRDESGRWTRLSGDQVGALLADHLLTNAPPPPAGATDLVASSIVSSRFIDRLAEAAGADSIRTLTGFKWVARPIVERPDDRYLLGYEEALGYCVGDRVRDKDGVSAALVVAELAAGCKSAGTTLSARLDELAERYGLYATRQVTVRLDDVDDERRAELMASAVAIDPGELAGVAVAGREDLAEGRHLPPTDGVVLDLADGARVIVRPSGTEPKIKAYLEVVEADVEPGGVERARDAANRRLDALAAAVESMLRGG